jgi:transcriptional regulator with XRE-family HTH domain
MRGTDKELDLEELAHGWTPSFSFGDRLRLLRAELGRQLNRGRPVPIEELAPRCGLNHNTWSTWENGASPQDKTAVVRKIVDGTGVNRDWLAWGDGDLDIGWYTETPRQHALLDLR